METAIKTQMEAPQTAIAAPESTQARRALAITLESNVSDVRRMLMGMSIEQRAVYLEELTRGCLLRDKIPEICLRRTFILAWWQYLSHRRMRFGEKLRPMVIKCYMLWLAAEPNPVMILEIAVQNSKIISRSACIDLPEIDVELESPR